MRLRHPQSLDRRHHRPSQPRVRSTIQRRGWTAKPTCALPGVQLDKAVVLGVSTGGYASIAYASTHHPKVNAIINVSGGKGSGSNQVCATESRSPGV